MEKRDKEGVVWRVTGPVHGVDSGGDDDTGYTRELVIVIVQNLKLLNKRTLRRS